MLPPTKLDALLQVLVGCTRMTLDGVDVTAGEEIVLPHAVIADRGGDIVVTMGGIAGSTRCRVPASACAAPCSIGWASWS